ncbi:MAG: hypothetical protein EBU21_17160, partial [Proteobacteria bacterium]|nr:hypothetical protein [Pseudomonadota bacterium]
MTITATAAAATGSTTLGDLGITAGTLSFTASVAAGIAGQAASTATLAEIGVTEASGNFTFVLTDGATPTTVTTAYTSTDTLADFALSMQTAIRTATSGSETVTYTAGIGFVIDLTAGTYSFDGSTAFATNAVGGNILAKVALTGTPTSTGHTGTPTGSALTTAAQSETVTVVYTTSDTLTGLATNIQNALQAAGVVGNSTDAAGTLAAATVSFSSGVISIDAVGTAVTFSAITDSGTAKTVLGGLGAGSRTAVTSTISPTQTETATVSYTTSDTLSTIAAKIATAVTGIGRVGTSLIAPNAGTAASFNAGTSMIDITGVDTDTTLTFSSGALRTALNLAAPNTSVSGTTSSSAAIVQNAYRLSSNALTGVTSISSSSTGSIDISTQTAASAAISTLDSAINQ